jgi:hypothetical protein
MQSHQIDLGTYSRDFHLFRNQRVRILIGTLPTMTDISSGLLQAVQKNNGDYRDRFLLDSFQFTVNYLLIPSLYGTESRSSIVN